jgi:hypothetical protein
MKVAGACETEKIRLVGHNIRGHNAWRKENIRERIRCIGAVSSEVSQRGRDASDQVIGVVLLR